MPARILIIEDNPTNLGLMVYLLEAFGYSAEGARGGKEGLEAVASQTPDLIICDLEMPEVDGFEVARQLKTTTELREIPLMAVSALAMVGDRERVLAAGFDGYIPKPINPETFVAQMETFLRPEQRSGRLPQAASAPAQHSPALRSKKGSILVVDDSPINLRLIRLTLEPFGFEVFAATLPDDAIELVRRHRLDLILSDMHRPRQSGLGFLRQIKADPQSRSIPFIFISASTPERSERERAFALGADRVITRPIEPQALLSEIESCIAKQGM